MKFLYCPECIFGALGRIVLKCRPAHGRLQTPLRAVAERRDVTEASGRLGDQEAVGDDNGRDRKHSPWLAKGQAHVLGAIMGLSPGERPPTTDVAATPDVTQKPGRENAPIELRPE
ncbi:hypothetical protein KRMM14A1259_51100 [Krasilnikovia sp. MM14-A1259]